MKERLIRRKKERSRVRAVQTDSIRSFLSIGGIDKMLNALLRNAWREEGSGRED